MLKDKRILVGFGVFIVLLVLGGGYYFLSQSSQKPVTKARSTYTIGKVSPQEIGLSIEMGSDASCLANKKNNQVKFTLDKGGEYKSVVGVFSYEADVSAQDRAEGAGDKITQSVEVDKDVNGDKVDSGFKLMGSCSKNVCRCDTGVSSVDLVLKLTKKDGSVYQSEKSLSF